MINARRKEEAVQLYILFVTYHCSRTKVKSRTTRAKWQNVKIDRWEGNQ